MNPNGTQLRLARLKRECEVWPVRALLLCVACAMLVVMLALSVATEETLPTYALEPVQSLTRPPEEVSAEPGPGPALPQSTLVVNFASLPPSRPRHER